MDQPAVDICGPPGSSGGSSGAPISCQSLVASMPMSASTTRPHLCIAGISRCAGFSAPKVTVRSKSATGLRAARRCRCRRRSAGRRRSATSASIDQLEKAVLTTACFEAALEAGSEQAVDQQRRGLRCRAKRLDLARSIALVAHLRRVALRLGQRRDPHRDARAPRGAAPRHSRRRHCCPARTGSAPASARRSGRPPRPAPPRPAPSAVSTLVPAVDRRLLGGAHRCGGEDRAGHAARL